MVSNLHSERFGDVSPNKEYSTSRKLVDDLRPAIKSLKPIGTDHVDPDLIALVERHLEQDIKRIELWNTGKRLADELQIDTSSPNAEAEISWMDSLLSHLSENIETETLSESQSEFLNDRYYLMEQQGETIWEIELMQARLEERYKGQEFRLPKIE